MKPDWQVSPLTPDRIEEVLEIEVASFESPWPREGFAHDRAGAEWARALILEDANRPELGALGFILFWTLEGELEIQNIAVAPAARRQGGAGRLMEEAWGAARRAGCRVAYLEVRPSNSAGLGLYRRWGFRPQVTRKGYYENGEDAIVMKAEIEPE